MSRQGEKTVCVITPLKGAYSETFIRAHIERLPANVKALYGGVVPTHEGSDEPIDKYASMWPIGLTRSAICNLFSLPPDYFRKKAFYRYLIRNNVAAVLAEYGPTGVGVMDSCVKARVPLLVHFHGYDVNDRKTVKSLEKGYAQLFNKASFIIAPSKYIIKRLSAIGCPDDKAVLNLNGVDTYFFRAGDPAASPPIFISVGRFVDKKAPYLTLLAFKKVREVYADARLVMVGDGILLETCRQIRRALRLDSSVEFLGVRTPNEVAEALRGARAFVQHSIETSYGDAEGLGIIFLEAGASCIPVVSTLHNGTPEIVIDGETGFLVEEGDIEGMAERMLLLAKDPNLARRMGQAARERIEKHFSIESSIENLWGIIKRAIGEGTPRA